MTSSPQEPPIVSLPITQGALNHSYLHLRAANLGHFPDDAIGGPNQLTVAPRRITWRLVGAPEAFDSDIDGDKAFVRTRGAVGDWYRRNQARAGDVIDVRRLGDYEYELAHVPRTI